MPHSLRLSFVLLIAVEYSFAATTRYIVPPGTGGVTPTPNYTSWTTAATNLYDMFGSFYPDSGDLVLLTNGTYYLTNNYVQIYRTITLRSFNNGIIDPTNTIIDANNYVGKLVTNSHC